MHYFMYVRNTYISFNRTSYSVREASNGDASVLFSSLCVTGSVSETAADESRVGIILVVPSRFKIDIVVGIEFKLSVFSGI